ncbi:MAG TPA: flagellar basal-body MS-ring/collar protein FliF [bacterium]|jgi:flagellar M-ring protein FliF
MENQNPSFIDQLRSLWLRMNASERLIMVSTIIIAGIALAIWVTAVRSPAQALLYGGLDPADAGEVIAELQSRNIEYDVKNGGATILVPADQVDELRITLASSGFTPSGVTGYELFDSNTIGMSDFIQRKQGNRALEGEISRTLMSLEEISAARVHLTMSEPTPFIAEQQDNVASVVLNVLAGRRLSDEKIGAVKTFVAGAIATNPDNVTIIDQNMNLLTGPQDYSSAGLMPDQEEFRRNYELQRANDIRSLLEHTYGMGKVAVSFTCEMDFDQVSRESMTFEPLEGVDHGPKVSEERTEQSASGEGYNAAAGVPGTESNLPTYPGTSEQPFETESATETINYETSSVHEMRTQAPGSIKKATVSVLIDNTDKNNPNSTRLIDPSEEAEVENLVLSAAGLDPTKGDTITVAFRPFDTSVQEDLASAKAELNKQAIWENVTRFIIVFAVLFILWFFVINPLRRPIQGVAAITGVQIPEEEYEPIELPTGDPEELEKLRIREEIEKLIKEDPASAAKVIKTWLQE